MKIFKYLLIVELIVISTIFATNVYDTDEEETPLASSLNIVRPKRNPESQTTQKPNQPRLTNEKRLIKDLLDNYQVKWGRPVNNMSEKVVVYFGINLVQLLDMVGKFFRIS